jgi:para-nitrobenzyl esterase
LQSAYIIKYNLSSPIHYKQAKMINRFLPLIALAVAMTGDGPLIAAISQPVRTETGLVSGVPARDASITVYKGLPFGAPPVGDLRWRAPQPPAPWQGVRKADQFGNVCIQAQGNTTRGSEDCLFLNVWTGAASGAERRPVFVWFYGGGFTSGAGSDALFDGEGLAKKGIVVVTMNYRLGVFGFLATHELSQESGHSASGNYGLLDDIAVLQWIKKNIAAFGGDPGNVTMAGQSAGAHSVLLLLSSPLAKGLFHRAIAESRARSVTPQKEEELAGSKYVDALGIHSLPGAPSPARSLKELRAMTPDQFKGGGGRGGNPFHPAIDGYVVPSSHDERVLQNDVPIMMGGNLDEAGGTPWTASPRPNATLDRFLSVVRQTFGTMADEFLKFYPASSDAEAGLAQNAAARDGSRVNTFLLATAGKKYPKNQIFTYFFTHGPPGSDHDRRGAYHESEINYIFNNLYATDRPWADEDWKIADTMSSYWANFAKTGDPNGKGLPAWQPSDASSPVVVELGDHFGPIPVAEKSKLDFLRRFYLTQDVW